MSRRHPGCVAALAVMLAAGFTPDVAVAQTPPAPRTLDECEALVAVKPQPSAWRCFWWIARTSGQGEEAARRLRAHMQIDGGNAAILLNLGRVLADQGQDEARLHLESAAALFARQSFQEAEFAARLALAFFCGTHGDHACEQAQFPRMEQIAAATGNADFQANVLLHEAHHAGHEADYGLALALTKQAEAVRLPDGPYYLKAHIQSGLVSTYWTLGRHQEAFEAAQLQADLARQLGDEFEQAAALHNVLLLAQLLDDAEQMPQERFLEMEQQALEVAVRSRNVRAEASIRLTLAQDPALSLDRRLDEAARALALARGIRQVTGICFALRLLAHLEQIRDPARLDAHLARADEAIAVARGAGDLFQAARGWVVRASLAWTAGGRAALEDSLRALDAIERIREMQPDDLVRTRFSAQWAMPFYRFSSQALEAGLAGDHEMIAAGFAMMERLRGRVLLDAMDSMRATERMQPRGAAAARRQAILDEIARSQKELLRSGITEPQRSRLLGDLDRLEAQEAALQSELAAQDARWSALRRPVIPSLEQVQEALAADEALLAFQVASDDTDAERIVLMEGGSWLLVITRGAVQVHRLPSRRKLQSAVGVYEALIQRRDGSELAGAAALYADLLADGLRGLPPPVRRLVVIPDDVLHRLPFDALRTTPAAPPLGERFEITLAPSATLWMTWRAATGKSAPQAVLALADPDPPEPDAGRDAVLRAGLAPPPAPGRLPRARREAAALAALIGGDSLVVSGPRASESFLKSADLSRFGLLHLAAHAIVDPLRPERSAVLLAAGDPREDGLLQMRDVVGLELQGRAVMLAACGSSSGGLMRGEGVMSLARAFFQAGSTAVIGSLWPLRDDEAEQFVGPLYRRLGQGESIAGAVGATRRELIAARAPTAAWAGMVVLGDGGMVPFAAAPARPSGGVPPWGLAAAAACVMLAAAGAAGAALRRRKRRALSDPAGSS